MFPDKPLLNTQPNYTKYYKSRVKLATQSDSLRVPTMGEHVLEINKDFELQEWPKLTFDDFKH